MGCSPSEDVCVFDGHYSVNVGKDTKQDERDCVDA